MGGASYQLWRTLLYNVAWIGLGYAYPLLESCQAVLGRDEEAYRQWTTYWLVFSLIRLAEVVLYIFLSLFPWYKECKILLIMWLVLPRFKGAAQIYHQVVLPYLTRYEGEIDYHINKLSDEAQRTAWTMSTRVVKEVTTAVVKQATTLVMSGQGAGALQLLQSVSENNTSSTGGGDGEAAMRGMMGLRSRSGLAVRTSISGEPSQPSTMDRRSKSMPSPMGATPSQVLAEYVRCMDEGIFVRLEVLDEARSSSSSSSRRASTASLHLLRLSSNRRALLWEDVNTISGSITQALPVAHILGIHVVDDSSSSTSPSSSVLDISYVSTTGAARARDVATSPPPGRQAAIAIQQRTLRLHLASCQDRDSMVAGLRILVRKARESYTLGAKKMRLVYLRQAWRHWKMAALYEMEFEGSGQDLGVLYGLEYRAPYKPGAKHT